MGQNSECDKTQKLKMWQKFRKTQNVTKHQFKMWQNSKILKMWQNSNTHNFTKLKICQIKKKLQNSKLIIWQNLWTQDVTNTKTQNVTKFKYSQFYKTQNMPNKKKNYKTLNS